MLIVLAAAMSLSGCAGEDVAFARKTITSLANGRYAARGMIDWTLLNCQGTDIGAQYKALPDDAQRLDYERAFIDNFRMSFASNKGSGSLNNERWSMLGTKEDVGLVIARNMKNRKALILVAVKHKSFFQRKVIAIHAIQVADEQKFEQFCREQLS